MKFKRFMSCLTAAVMVLCMASVLPFTAVAETVELFKDTFEDGYGGWAPRGDATIEIVDTTANTGEKSLYISGRVKNWNGAGCSKVKELACDGTYKFTAYVMQDEGNDTEQINLQMLYKDAYDEENYKNIASVQAKKGVWTKVEGTYTIPLDASEMTIYLETPSNLINFYIDDISAEGEPVDDSDIVEGFTEDFENGVNDWGGRGDAKCEISTGNGHNDSDCLYTYNRQQLWNAPSANKAKVLNAGNYYKFSGWVMYKGEYKSSTETIEYPQTQKFSLYLQYQKDGKENYYEVASSTANIGEWTYIEGEYTLPETASNFVVYFQTGYKPDASVQTVDLMDFYLDDVSAERLPDPEIEDYIPSLKDVYSDYFKLGCAATATELQTKATQDLIKKHYNSLTLGNELKPDSTLNLKSTLAYLEETGDDTNPQISLDNAATLLSFAEENNIPIRGHVFVWHSQTPDWFFKENFDAEADWVTPEKMNQRLENYMKNVVDAVTTQYPDLEIYAWDIVNEAFKDTGGMRDAGSNNTVNGQSAWMSVYGDDSFIDKAFELAREIMPEGCKLFYNDYNEYIEAKRDDIYEKCKELAEKGLIDGVGMQSHIKMSSPTISLYEEAIRKYDSLGLEVQITELDIDQKSNSEEDQLDLAKRYNEVFKLYKSLKDEGVNITAVVIWGITDSTSWIGGYPLLFAKDYSAKPAFYAVADTEAEIQTIKKANALKYDGTATDYEKAFKLQKANEIGDVATFKTIWNDDKVIVRFNSNVDGDASVIITPNDLWSVVIGEGISLKKGDTADLEIDLSKLPNLENNTFYLEVVVTDENNITAWNTLNYGEDTKCTYGRLTFIEQPLTAYGVYNTPEVDGEIDACWNMTSKINVDKYTMGSDGATATARAMWDAENIYVLVEVKDGNLSKANANAYEQDTVEIFIDENNGKTSYYENDDIQLRVNFDNEVTVTDGRTADIYTTAAKKTADGYIVEVAIPTVNGGFTAGQVIGYDVQINDDNGEGKRTGIANWSDLTGQGYINTAGFGTLTLESGIDDIQTGDVNVDGEVNTADVVLLQKFLCGKVKAIAFMATADMDDNTLINIFDLISLKRIVTK